MNTSLQQRRYRMLQLLALGNTPHSVIPKVSEEFECSQNTVYKDYQNMERWGKKFRQDKQMEYLLYARLELLSRTATENMLSAKNSPDRVRAANLVLKITQEQKRIENMVEAQKSSSQFVLESLSLRMPFECDPLIKQAYLDEQKKQRASAIPRAENDNDAKAESNSGH